MALGSPQTKKALIGTFELRLGPLERAGRLSSSDSVGIIDEVKLDIQMDSIDLLAGFPQKPVDTAIVKFVTGFTAKLREASRRNLNILLGNTLTDYDTSAQEVSGLVSTLATIAPEATSLVFDLSFSGTLSQGDTVVVYDTNNPGNLSCCIVNTFTAKSGSTPASVTFKTGNGIVQGHAIGDSVRFYKTSTVPGGAITGVPKYFSAQLIRLDRGTGRPVGFNFWKTTLASGMSLGATIAEFASMDLQLKALEPALSDYTGTGKLVHVADVIEVNPVFVLFDVSDYGTSTTDVGGGGGGGGGLELTDSTGSALTDSTGSPLLAAA